MKFGGMLKISIERVKLAYSMGLWDIMNFGIHRYEYDTFK